MSTVWIDQHSRLKSYSASVKGSKAIVRIEIECGEPGSLGFLLEELRNIEREQQHPKKRDDSAGFSKKELPKPRLALPYFGGRDD